MNPQLDDKIWNVMTYYFNYIMIKRKRCCLYRFILNVSQLWICILKHILTNFFVYFTGAQSKGKWPLSPKSPTTPKRRRESSPTKVSVPDNLDRTCILYLFMYTDYQRIYMKIYCNTWTSKLMHFTEFKSSHIDSLTSFRCSSFFKLSNKCLKSQYLAMSSIVSKLAT